MTQVFNTSAPRIWPCVFPGTPLKSADIKAHGCTKLAMCLGSSNMCVSADCKYTKGNTSCCPPDLSVLSIRVKPPHTCRFCLYMKGRNSLGFFGIVWENDFRSLPLGVSEPVLVASSMFPRPYTTLMCIPKPSMPQRAISV